MATAQEILNAMEEVEEQNVIVIDSDLRTIRIPEGIKILGVESDDDVLRLHFKMPKMYGEFDLSTFALRVNYLNANGDGDVFEVQDAAANGDELEFSWLVGRTAAQYKGDVKFIVCAKKVKEGGIVEKEFNTTPATLPVLEGLETIERVAQENPDVIEAILLRLDKLEKNGGGAEPDATLTQSGKAADAKATGDALNELKEANDAQDEAIAKKLDASELPTAINTALAQAKESGQFDGAPGAPGYTPQKGVDYFDGKDGEPGDPGEPGKDYVLTEADKEEIAEMAAEKVEVPEGGGSYTLPIASPDVLGGVKPAAKTDSMTQEIGVDADGKLWGLPGGGGRNWELIADITLTELVRMIEITKDLDGNPFSLSEIVIDASTKQERADGEDFTGNRNLQVIINSGGAGWFNLKFSSGTEFVPFFAHYQAIGGVVFGYAKRTVEKVAASYSSKVEANAVNTQRADAINSISIDSEYIHVNGTQNRFSLGTSVKIYGVRT